MLMSNLSLQYLVISFGKKNIFSLGDVRHFCERNGWTRHDQNSHTLYKSLQGIKMTMLLREEQLCRYQDYINCKERKMSIRVRSANIDAIVDSYQKLIIHLYKNGKHKEEMCLQKIRACQCILYNNRARNGYWAARCQPDKGLQKSCSYCNHAV